VTHDVFIFKNNFYYFIGLKDGPVLLLWFVIFVRVYWGTTTTITISNHNIGILAPFRFPDPTSFQCFQSGNLGRYQNTKLPVIMIFQILVFFLRQISRFMNYYTPGCYECTCMRLISFVRLISSLDILYIQGCALWMWSRNSCCHE